MARPHSTEKLPMGMNEIIETETQKKQSKIYKAESMQLADDKIASAIGQTINELMSMNPEPVTLSDVETIKKCTLRYLKGCEQACTIPSTSGLARSLGVSRNALYDYCKRNPKSKTAQWIEVFKDVCTDVLSESALRNNANPVFSMFLLKSCYGFVDRQVLDITAQQTHPFDDLPDPADVESKYAKYLSALPREAFELPTDTEEND